VASEEVYTTRKAMDGGYVRRKGIEEIEGKGCKGSADSYQKG
jgi:hypothetical protein